jgi:hypothetical protein
MDTKRPKLTGLHAQLCPQLIDLGFKVFSKDRINLICSITNTGSFTDPSSTPNKACKKAEGLLPLTFEFLFPTTNPRFQNYHYYLDISILDSGIIGGSWISEDFRKNKYPIWGAVQRFEIEMQAKYNL